MALSKKGSRSIHVDGADYRWAFSNDSGYSVVMVQSAEGMGQKLAVYIHWSEITYSFRDDNGSIKVTPGLVRDMICGALKQGWVPAELGQDFVCDLLRDETLKPRR